MNPDEVLEDKFDDEGLQLDWKDKDGSSRSVSMFEGKEETLFVFKKEGKTTPLVLSNTAVSALMRLVLERRTTC